jgi:hypothetical protein
VLDRGYEDWRRARSGCAPRHATFTTVLMSTGLTLRDDLLPLRIERRDHRQDPFWLAVTGVVLTAVVPTAVAERWFLLDGERELRIDPARGVSSIRGPGLRLARGVREFRGRDVTEQRANVRIRAQ